MVSRLKFLICGIGSIGQRHYKNLQSLGHELALFRSRESTTPFIDIFFTEQAKQGHKPKIFYDLKEALDQFRPDGVFVTNPNHLHLNTAIEVAKAGCHLFIEKPVHHNLEGLDELVELKNKSDLVIMVGYNLRFHPLLQKMKKMVDGGKIGFPISAHVEMAENIEDWHPWEDYRHTYAVHKSSGGGVVLCFSHDIDYLYWFLGIPNRIFSVGGKLTPLVGTAEDMTKSIMEFDRSVIASVHLDYWQRPPKRFFEIIGSKGRIHWDYYAGMLTFQSRENLAQKRVWNVLRFFERNTMFIDEVKHFVNAIKKKSAPLITLEDGVEVLKICEEIKQQLENNRP